MKRDGKNGKHRRKGMEVCVRRDTNGRLKKQRENNDPKSRTNEGKWENKQENEMNFESDISTLKF